MSCDLVGWFTLYIRLPWNVCHHLQLEVNVPIFLNACGVYLNMLWELLIYLAQQVIVGINFTIVWLQENIFV